jgi:peroxiredoxin
MTASTEDQGSSTYGGAAHADADLLALNDVIRYTGWAVFKAAEPFEGSAADLAKHVGATLYGESGAPTDPAGGPEEPGVVVRGIYDVSGLRADADLMFWLHAPRAEQLQQTFRAIRRGAAAADAELQLSWSSLGLHRAAEFSKTHVPAFLTGVAPRGWVTVYPFVRTKEWYLLPEDERRAMLGEHGRMGREYPQVVSNTVSAFALGDYEWMLALESDDLHDLVDLMRHLRYSGARRHVTLETPFFTGRRIGLDELGDVVA